MSRQACEPDVLQCCKLNAGIKFRMGLNVLDQLDGGHRNVEGDVLEHSHENQSVVGRKVWQHNEIWQSAGGGFGAHGRKDAHGVGPLAVSSKSDVLGDHFHGGFAQPLDAPDEGVAGGNVLSRVIVKPCQKGFSRSRRVVGRMSADGQSQFANHLSVGFAGQVRFQNRHEIGSAFGWFP